jgi:hypothetical protein
MSMSHHSLTLRSLLVLTIVLGLNGCYKYWKTLNRWPVLVDHIWAAPVLQVLIRYGLRPYIRRR